MPRRALEPLAKSAPRDAVVQFNYGIALYCAGYVDEAAQALRTAKSVGRDTIYEMRADEILHPQYFVPQDGLYPLFQQTRPTSCWPAASCFSARGTSTRPSACTSEQRRSTPMTTRPRWQRR